jgi:hypothetical protein
MSYKSLGTKAYKIGKALGSRGLSLATLGSRINPISSIGNAIIRKGIEIGSHKLMSAFTPTNMKKIK